MLLLGGNVGDVKGRLDSAKELISSRVGRVTKCSSKMASQPWGFDATRQKEVEPFINQAMVVETETSATELLSAIQQIEEQLGRQRVEESELKSEQGVRYLSRKIDIDIIFYGDQMIQSQELTIPHALMAEREFVLEPIVEIAPEWRHPGLGVSCRELLNRLK